jgi:alpha-methylacyl-CoA racemase
VSGPHAGPLAGLRVVELGGIGPAPFAGMVLADLGADVIRLERPPGSGGPPVPNEHNLLLRGRRSVALDLRKDAAREAALALVARADATIEGFRPGVTERLGLGPEECLARNPRLAYGRITGWGQDGPLAPIAGHDITYLAMTGALDAIGHRGDRPVVPLNLVADFGGGGMLLALGVVCAILEARSSGQGQVVDAAMVDGVGLLSTLTHGMLASGMWRQERETNLLDGGAHFYDTYATADGRAVAVGAIEPQFYAQLLAGMGLDPAELPEQMDERSWPATKARFAEVFRGRTRDEWAARFAGTDACVAPVLTFDEAREHEHQREREGYVEVAGVPNAAPAPRFGRTPGAIRSGPPADGAHTAEVLAEIGLTPEDVA